MWDIPTPLGPQQSDTQHTGREAQPCSDTTSQAEPIQLLKTQVLRRGKHEPCKSHRGAITGRCGTFQQKATKK